MQSVLQKRIRKMCEQKFGGKTLRKSSDSAEVQIRRSRTVRNVTVSMTPTPLISKHIISLEPADQPSATLSFRRSSKRCSDTALDKIIARLRNDNWPSKVLLLITPSSKHRHQYKMHMIDRTAKTHLGMTSITKRELSQLQFSKSYRKYCIIMGTRYIDLKTVALETAIIANLANVLNGDCHENGSDRSRAHAECGQLDPNPPESHETNANRDVIFPSEKAKEKLMSSPPPSRHVKYSQAKELSNPLLAVLLERINTALEPQEKDLQRFFDLAEKYKFKIYVRPELCWKTSPELERILGGRQLPRFNLECFMLFDNYVGGISLNTRQLEEQLVKHPGLLGRVDIVSDVCEITPLPRPIVCCMRKLSDWLGMEMLYDAFGEFVFDIYKQLA